jgi:DNA-binding CsgD family transcriptional regulator/catechol 2,3-dioxygenase-like lactoylglutathione lyase family enzyme
MIQRRGRPPHPDQLTPAEWRVVEAVRHGLSNPEIARRMNVSLDAVKFHVANVLSKLGFSSRRDIQRWSGVSNTTELARRRGEMPMHHALGPIGQIARSVKDIEAAREWYSQVLRLPHLFSFGNLAFFDCGGVRLFLTEGEPNEAQSILYFQVGDIHAAKSDLESRGVTFINAPHLIHRHEDGSEEWMAFFNDLDGHPLGLMSRVPFVSSGIES